MRGRRSYSQAGRALSQVINVGCRDHRSDSARSGDIPLPRRKAPQDVGAVALRARLRVSPNRVLRAMRENQVPSPCRWRQADPKAYEGTIITGAPKLMWGTEARRSSLLTTDGCGCSSPSSIGTPSAEAGTSPSTARRPVCGIGALQPRIEEPGRVRNRQGGPRTATVDGTWKSVPLRPLCRSG